MEARHAGRFSYSGPLSVTPTWEFVTSCLLRVTESGFQHGGCLCVLLRERQVPQVQAKGGCNQEDRSMEAPTSDLARRSKPRNIEKLCPGLSTPIQIEEDSLPSTPPSPDLFMKLQALKVLSWCVVWQQLLEGPIDLASRHCIEGIVLVQLPGDSDSAK